MKEVKFPELDRMKATRKAAARHLQLCEDEMLPELWEKEPPRMVLRIKTAACEVICGLHLAAAAFMTLFLDVSDRWGILLMAIGYCFLVGLWFGVMAAFEEDDEVY